MSAPFTPTPSADDRPPPHWSPTPMRTQPTPVRSVPPRPARLRFCAPKSGHASQFCQKNADIASGEPHHQNQPQHTTLSVCRAHGALRHGHGTGTRPPHLRSASTPLPTLPCAAPSCPPVGRVRVSGAPPTAEASPLALLTRADGPARLRPARGETPPKRRAAQSPEPSETRCYKGLRSKRRNPHDGDW